MKVCPRCGGSGEVTDPLVLGQTLRKMRVEAGVTLLRMAEVMKISQGHLSDLENGNRAWLGGITSEQYCDALDAEIERMKK
jgi:transcriptional regulator with XRE-family HTH domain